MSERPGFVLDAGAFIEYAVQVQQPLREGVGIVRVTVDHLVVVIGDAVGLRTDVAGPKLWLLWLACAAVGVIAAGIVALGNPGNMGICGA